MFADLFAGAAGSIGSSLLGGLFGNKNAKTGAEAAAQDQRTTATENEFFQQLQQQLSKMDKNLAEQLFGTSNATDIMSQLQNMTQQQATDTTQTTTRGDAAVNTGVSNVLQQTLQGLMGGGNPMELAMQKVLRSGAPALAGVSNRSGTFGDTTTALLQNDLMAKAAQAGVDANTNLITQLGQLLQGGTESTTGKQNLTNQQATNTSGQSTSQQQNTQNRTATESATEATAGSSAGSSNKTSDAFQDFLKDGSAGYGTNKNVIADLGKGMTQGGTTNPLQLLLPALQLPVAGQPAPGAGIGDPTQLVNNGQNPVTAGQPNPLADLAIDTPEQMRQRLLGGMSGRLV